MKSSIFSERFVIFALCIFVLSNPPSHAAAYRTVIGGPEYNAATGNGFRNPSTGGGVNAVGTAIGSANKFTGGVDLGSRAVRWNEAGVVELGNLGVDPSGTTASQASAINSAGLSVGYASLYSGGAYLGDRAVRWNASGTAATQLGHIGVGFGSITFAYAVDVNESGTIAGSSEKFVSGVSTGIRAVRWNSGGTSATELGHLGLLFDSFTYAYAYGINDLGTVVGVSDKPSPTGTYGTRAVRWNAGLTTAVELGNLGTDVNGNTGSTAYDVNNSGTVVGIAFKHESGVYVGQRAVRWEGGSTIATELETLGFDANGVGMSYASGINDDGTVIGTSTKYDGDVDMGLRAVRWDSTSTSPRELGNLGTDSLGLTRSEALGLNDDNLVVGNARKYVSGVNVGTRAVLWRENGVAVDLNRFIDPASGWILESAQAISGDGWIKGVGLFDPDGASGQAAYSRLFLIQIPEPGTMVLLVTCAVSFALRSASRLTGNQLCPTRMPIC
jgi:probable HAF family extracellular repeat protein